MCCLCAKRNLVTWVVMQSFVVNCISYKWEKFFISLLWHVKLCHNLFDAHKNSLSGTKTQWSQILPNWYRETQNSARQTREFRRNIFQRKFRCDNKPFSQWRYDYKLFFCWRMSRSSAKKRKYFGIFNRCALHVCNNKYTRKTYFDCRPANFFHFPKKKRPASRWNSKRPPSCYLCAQM